VKIGIIGLLPEQAHYVKQQFPNYAIEFLPREREREAAAFAQRHSKVVLMTKFISHSVQNAVPIHKRVHISGGTTALAKWLNTQASAVTVTKPTPVHKEPEMAPAANDKPLDFAPLKTLDIGESLVLKRPKQTTLKGFEANVNSTRSYYKTKHGVITVVEFKEGSATITVVERNKPSKKKGEQVAAEPAPVLPRAETGVAWMPHLRDFWQQVYVARAALGLPNDLCVNDADVALEHARHRFG